MLLMRSVSSSLFQRRYLAPMFASARTPSIKYLSRSTFASLAHYDDDDGDDDKHCPTCSCDSTLVRHDDPLPPPLPQPKYSVQKRVLPFNLTALSSPQGRQLLLETLSSLDDKSPYWSLTEHFINQSDPAYCGVTTLVMVLNSMSVDPQIRWRGGWRYYGDEDVLLSRCCLSSERIRRIGITMEEFQQLARCQGLAVELKRPSSETIDAFRRDMERSLLEGSKVVVSFSRAALGQTGDGHFSPIAAYHPETDSVLVLDVARFKYPPYWVSLTELYQSMLPVDTASNQPRGWFVLRPPQLSASYTGEINNEHRRPARLVKEVGQPDICPIGKVKVEFCRSNHYQPL